MDAASSFSGSPQSTSSGPGSAAGLADRLKALRGSRGLRLAGWAFVFFGCLFAFTALKFPENRIRLLVIGQINAALAPRGISIAPDEAHIRFGFGVSLVMNNVQINFPAPAQPVRIEYLRIHPSLLPLIFNKISTGIELNQGEGSLDAHLSIPMQPAQGGAAPISLEFDASALNLTSIGAGAFLGGMPLSGTVSGEGSFAGDLNSPETWQGKGQIAFAKMRTDPQQIAGFQIPALSVGEIEGEFAIDTQSKKIVLDHLRFGKPGGSDDVNGNLTGDIALSGRSAVQLPLSLTAKFSLSDRLRKELVLLDAILGPGKQSDGSYAYKIGGTLGSPFPTPIAAPGAPAPAPTAPGDAGGP